MSDIFDAFESNTQTTSNANLFDMVADPAAEFLAREQEELAKIENDDFLNENKSTVDQFGSMKLESENNGFNDFGGVTFNNDFGESSTDPFVKSEQNDDHYSAISKADKLSQEPEKIKRWREEQKLRLTKKDTEEEQKMKEWREAAKKELDDWYKNRQEQLAKTIANNKVNNKATEAELVASRETEPSSLDWDRMAKLCDFNPKANKNTKDVTRMRSILLHLKQNPLQR